MEYTKAREFAALIHDLIETGLDYADAEERVCRALTMSEVYAVRDAYDSEY
jgi:hypothetical protein